MNSVVDAVRDCGGSARVLDCALYEPDAEDPEIEVCDDEEMPEP